MNERKSFGEIVWGTVSEVETYPRRFTTHMLHNPREAALYGALVATSLYAFVFQEGAEAQRNLFFPILAKAAASSIVISIPVSLWMAHLTDPNRISKI